MRMYRLTTFDRLNKDYPGEDISPGVIAKKRAREHILRYE